MTASESYIKRILDARVYDVATQTRLHRAHLLSKRLNNRVLLKREDEQPIFSFKCRGAFNRLFKLTQKQSVTGVVAASAGNHAQGVALASSKLGLSAIIVMPVTTPQIKIDAVNALGAEAVLYGDDFNAAFVHAKALSEEKSFPFIHPFDDPDTIAGQGTIGVELCQQHPDPIDYLFLPIGGGGLAAGVSAYLKYLRPEIKIIGVEPVDAACMKAALQAGQPVELEQVGLFADGVAVRRAGDETFKICQETLDDIVLVTVDEMSSAIKDIFNETRTLTEPAGALALAGLKKYAIENDLSDSTLVAINSGANINFDRLRHVAERAEIGESREALFAVTIPEVPGSFREFCHALGRRSITEFNYRFHPGKVAEIFVGVELHGGDQERIDFQQQLHEQGYSLLDMTKNDTAKLHIRHMIGGRTTGEITDNSPERLYRFRFPERPGALMDFLSSMDADWNITLFHYRNHGAAYGRVLVGMQIGEHAEERFVSFLDGLGFSYEDETNNQAYERFLL